MCVMITFTSQVSAAEFEWAFDTVKARYTFFRTGLTERNGQLMLVDNPNQKAHISETIHQTASKVVRKGVSFQR